MVRVWNIQLICADDWFGLGFSNSASEAEKIQLIHLIYGSLEEPRIYECLIYCACE
jgi:hypothetical protein